MSEKLIGRTMGLLSTFPFLLVDLVTILTLLPMGCIFRYESLTNKLDLRWEVPLQGITLSKRDYRSEMFKDNSHICGFMIWTLQLLFNYYMIYYHLRQPHHPKFYSTVQNKTCMILHMIGGALGINGFYFGAILNIKEICIAGAIGGCFLHIPTVVWHNRQTHGQREMSTPYYLMCWVLLLQSYIDFVLYDATYQTVFSCAMTLNVYGMVRFYYMMGRPFFCDLQQSYDRALFFALFSNYPLAQGMFSSMYFLFGIYIWSFYFKLLRPCPKFMMRIERGYWDSIPNELEKKKGITFEEALATQTEMHPNNKKEAISKALWTILAGDETLMGIGSIVDLYKSWGLQDAESAANETFRRVDLNNSGSVDYDEFKKGFNLMIEGIYLFGEFQAIEREFENLVEKENGLSKKK